MTKPRPHPSRELFGILGALPNRSAVQKTWNAYFRARGIDASLDVYPTSVEKLPERLSEMFHFDRRGYIVAPSLVEAIKLLLDRYDNAPEKGSVLLVRNVGGVLEGHWVDSIDAVESLSQFLREGSI